MRDFLWYINIYLQYFMLVVGIYDLIILTVVYMVCFPFEFSSEINKYNLNNNVTIFDSEHYFAIIFNI